MKNPTRIVSHYAALAAALLLSAISSPAAEYHVEHNFRLRPGGNQVPVIRGIYYCHAWTTETRPDCSDWDVNPDGGAQPLGWGPFGRDSQYGTKGPVRNSGNGGGRVEAQKGQIAIPATGFWDLKWATADDCDASADANSEWNVNAVGAGGVVTGTITAWGEATAAGRPHRRSKAYAFSMTSIEAQGSTLRRGKLKWRSVVRDTVRGSARAQKDPVDFTVTDLVTGEQHRGTLLSISMDMLPQSKSGGITWDSNRVAISATDLNMNIELPGRYTSLTGRLDLQIRGGVVASSSASGIYAGNVPPVGTPVPLEFDLVNDIEFDYDLTSLTPAGNDVDVEIEMYGSGEAVDEKGFDEIELTSVTVPGDSTLVLTWPVTDTATYALESCPVITGGKWHPVLAEVVTRDDMHVVKVPMEKEAQFFRLVGTLPPPCQILIYQQPMDVTVQAGEVATFFVEASGNPVPEKYQWQRSDGNGEWADIPEAIKPVLFFHPGSEPFFGTVSFRCVIDNGCTFVTSAEATLTVRFPVVAQHDFAAQSLSLRPVGDGLYEARPQVGITLGSGATDAVPLDFLVFVNGELRHDGRGRFAVRSAVGCETAIDCTGVCFGSVNGEIKQGDCFSEFNGCNCSFKISLATELPILLPLSPGDMVQLVLDPDNAVPELDESNNDLVTRFNPDPTETIVIRPQPGDTVAPIVPPAERR